MRFSLRTALAAITLLGLGLGMTVEHGMLGIGMLLPPTLLVVGAVYLWRKGWQAASISCVTVYLLLWGGTELWGTDSFQKWAETKLSEIGPEELGPFRRLSFDPIQDRTRRGGPPPWYYLSQPHSPCPLVVYADHGWCAEPGRGSGGRSYVLWCCGWHSLTSKFYWSM